MIIGTVCSRPMDGRSSMIEAMPTIASPLIMRIGVKHQHVFVGAAKSAYPFGDIARLAGSVLFAAPVIDADRRTRGQFAARRLLPLAMEGVGIAQNEEIDPFVRRPLRRSSASWRERGQKSPPRSSL